MSPCPGKQRRERGEALAHDRDPERPSDEQLAEVLTSARTIAVVGMSDRPGKAARSIPLILLEQGWDVIPVNPNHDTVAGRRSWPTLADVPTPVDLVNVFRPSEATPQVVREAAAIGAGAIWLQAGIRSDEARAIAEEAGMRFVQNACSGALVRRLGLRPA